MIHRFFLVFHRWVALAATIVILVVSLSGSALVFEGAMDRGMHPELWRVTPGATVLSLDTILARAHAAVPKSPVTGVTISPVPDRAYLVQAGGTQVFVDPYAGSVRGTRTIAEWNATLPRRLHVLHVTLLASKIGGEIVAIATIVSLLLVLSGVYIWWRDKIWRVRWSASWKRVVFDLHHSLGAIAAVVLVVITASGLVIHYGALNKLMYMLDRTPPPEMLDQYEPLGVAPQISADSLYHIALATLPGASVTFLSLPPKRDQPFTAAMRFPGDFTPGGRSRVMVDRYRGTVLLAASTRSAQPGTRLANVLRSAHTGDLMGKPTEVVWLLAALVLALQGVSGFLMWWNARASRAALARAGRTAR
ncbi:MAG: putative iron-regulated rane protein [Gemmatimonadetes bacterium]|nr:putative iron-regulated rane protein [Gemmatimonadota bacterium]